MNKRSETRNCLAKNIKSKARKPASYSCSGDTTWWHMSSICVSFFPTIPFSQNQEYLVTKQFMHDNFFLSIVPLRPHLGPSTFVLRNSHSTHLFPSIPLTGMTYWSYCDTGKHTEHTKSNECSVTFFPIRLCMHRCAVWVLNNFVNGKNGRLKTELPGTWRAKFPL